MATPQGNTPFITVSKEDESITVNTTFTTLFNVDLEGYADAVYIKVDTANYNIEYNTHEYNINSIYLHTFNLVIFLYNHWW